MPAFTVRSAIESDLPALTDIYNHYVLNTAVTFDLQAFAATERRSWFDDHPGVGPHRLFVATDEQARAVGYATSSRWRAKPAYGTTVEVSVFCRPDIAGQGCGTALYATLFAALEHEDVHTIVAGISPPNAASVALHRKFGFRSVGVFHAVGRKFDRFWDVEWFERPLRNLDAPVA